MLFFTIDYLNPALDELVNSYFLCKLQYGLHLLCKIDEKYNKIDIINAKPWRSSNLTIRIDGKSISENTEHIFLAKIINNMHGKLIKSYDYGQNIDDISSNNLAETIKTDLYKEQIIKAL